MKTAWILYEFVPVEPDNELDCQVVGVFDSRESAIAKMKPGEVGAPFKIGERLDGIVPFIPGEFEMLSDGKIIDRDDPRK